MPPTYTDEGLVAAQTDPATSTRSRHRRPVPVRRGRLRPEALTETSERVGYLLKDRIADVAEFIAALERSPAAEPSSSRPSSPNCSPHPPPTTRSPS